MPIPLGMEVRAPNLTLRGPGLGLAERPSAAEAIAPIAELAERCGPEVSFVEVDQIHGSLARSARLALAPSGVWVIGSLAAPDEAEVLRPLRGAPRLLIGGNDGARLIRGLMRQLASVYEVTVAYDPEVEVLGAICLPDLTLPRFRTVSVDGCPLLSPTALARRLAEPGPLDAWRHGQLEWELKQTFGG